MTSKSTQPLASFYCFCSEAIYEEILKKQQSRPLAFSQFLEEYTNCLYGCGSCIDGLRKYLTDRDCLIE